MNVHIDDGGLEESGKVACRKCATSFIPKEWQVRKHDYECAMCKRVRQNGLNRSDPLFAEKKRLHNSRPHVQKYNYDYQKTKLDPAKRRARRKVSTEIEAGRLVRLPCQICGASKSEAHHDDYSKPLDIKWLCRAHHVEADAMLAARQSKRSTP